MSAPRPVVATAVVAGLVAVLALGAVALLRFQRSEADDGGSVGPPATSKTDAAATCGSQPCEVLTSLPVGTTTVELLADTDGRNGRLRVLGPSEMVLETALASMNVKLTQKSLSCMEGSASACVVRGRHKGGVAGEVFVAREGNWRSAEQPYFSNAGYLDLLEVAGNSSPEVGVAQHRCAGPDEACGGPVTVEVFGLDGDSLGCTPEYGTLTQVPGWPDIELSGDDLAACS